MLDIGFIRENKDFVSEKAKQKGLPADIGKLLKLDEDRRELLASVEQLRRKRNELSSTKGKAPDKKYIEQGKQLKVELAEKEHYLNETEVEFTRLLKTVPNMPLDDVPVGKSEDDNQVVKEWGDKPKFSFKALSHAQLGEKRGFIDKQRAAKVAGARFTFLLGDLVKLQFALLNFAMNQLTDEKVLKKVIEQNKLKTSPKPFLPVLPPYMIKTEVYDGMDRLEPRDDRYKIEGEDLWLQGSAEHVLGPMHQSEIIAEAELPVRYLGYTTAFRREAGSYGKDMEGIFRLHQFDKLEMESFSAPENGLDEHKLMIGLQEHLMQALKLPYRVLNKCTVEIGKPNARGVDIEVWLPSQNKYRETHTADYMTDYQARRLKTRFKNGSGEINLVHTNDGTAVAGRILIAILENNQTKNGKVKVPEVLKPFMGNQDEI